MKNDKLTAYDEFIIGKNKSVPFEEEKNSVKENDTVKFSNAYEDYLKQELRRTSPSEERVMTQEEFNMHGPDRKILFKNEGSESSGSTASEKTIRFKKFGKILLCAYVIIMLCLALIVVVKTTTVDNSNSAGATDAPVENSAPKIEKMQDEETEKNGDWFDSLCDSLK